MVEDYLKLASKLFQDEDKKYECIALLAHATENHGDYQKKEHGVTSANLSYKKALRLYREIPLQHRANLHIDNKIDAIQNKIVQSGLLIKNELKFTSTKPIDISELIEQSINHVKGKESEQEALLFFSGISYYNFENTLKLAKEVIDRNPIISLIKTRVISQDGRTVAEITPTNNKNIEDRILQQAIKDYTKHMELSAQGCIIPALEQIQQEHIFPKAFIIQICECSPMVPKKREILVSNALYHGFEGDFGTAIYLLAPQVENMIRQLLKQNGIVTTHIDKNDIEHEMGLSSLVNIKGEMRLDMVCLMMKPVIPYIVFMPGG